MDKLIFDIGATNMKFALMSNEGEILARKKIPTPYDSLESYLKAFEDLSAEYLDRVDGVGISTNGRMMADGNTYRAYTRDFLVGVDLKKELEERLHKPVVVENDGMAAAIGEWWKGAAKGANTVLGIVLGSAMGGGVIVDGKPWRGSRRNSAMIFAQLTTANPSEGNYAISALEASFTLFMYLTAMTKQMDPAEMTGEKFFELVDAGDPVACAMLKKFCGGIAVTIFNNALMLDPDKVVVTGGLAERQVLVEGIRAALKEITEKSIMYGGKSIMSYGIPIDMQDLQVDFVKGDLCLDANLYGALYCTLNEK